MVHRLCQSFGNWRHEDMNQTETPWTFCSPGVSRVLDRSGPSNVSSQSNVSVHYCKQNSQCSSTKVRTTVQESFRSSQPSTSPPPFFFLAKWISSLFNRVSSSILGRLEIRMRRGHTSVAICRTDRPRVNHTILRQNPAPSVSYLHRPGKKQVNRLRLHGDSAVGGQLHLVLLQLQDVTGHWGRRQETSGGSSLVFNLITHRIHLKLTIFLLECDQHRSPQHRVNDP